MPFNYAYAWGRSMAIARQLQQRGLTSPCANLPIIYIPGIIGSKLYDTRSRVNVWGDPMPLLRPKPEHASYALDESGLTAWERRHEPMKEPPRTIATEQLHSFAVIPKLVETLVTKELAYVLENALGYKEGRDLFFLGHDWRQDYRLLSLRLDEQMQRIRTVYGQNCKVVVIGQSVASLAIKFWLLNTDEANLNSVARWYSFGPPQQGTFHALSMLHGGYYPASQKFRGFAPSDIRTCPSCYQLMPAQPRVMSHKGTMIEDFSFYDPACWQAYGLGPWHEAHQGEFSPDALKQYLALGQVFNEALNEKPERLKKVSQAWFLGDANRAVYAAVAVGKKLLFTAKTIQKEAADVAAKALVKGDDHLPLVDFARQPNGAFVRNYENIPYGENYMLVGQPKDHRALINYGANLKALAFDLAVVRRKYK